MKRIESSDPDSSTRDVLATFTLVGDDVVADYRDRDYQLDVEVNGKRFAVSVWAPDVGPVVAAGAAAGGGRARPKPTAAAGHQAIGGEGKARIGEVECDMADGVAGGRHRLHARGQARDKGHAHPPPMFAMPSPVI